jgi:hypothetical protein
MPSPSGRAVPPIDFAAPDLVAIGTATSKGLIIVYYYF